MTRKNPFRTIRRTLSWVAVVAFGLFYLFAIAMLLIMLVGRYGPHILWQAPLVLVVFIALGVAIGFGCSAIQKAWRKAERKWDNKTLEQ